MKGKELLSFGIILVFVFLVFIPISKCATPDGLSGDDIIPIEDANLKEFLISATCKNAQSQTVAIDTNSDGEISVNEIQNVWALSIDSIEITDYSLFKYATNLNYLTLSKSPMESLTITENFTNLRSITLDECSNLKAISISNLEKLEYIFAIVQSNVTTVKLENLPALITVNLSQCAISEISMTNTPKIERLYLRQNNITDLNFLDNDFSALIEVDLLANYNLDAYETTNAQIIEKLETNGVDLSIDKFKENPEIVFELNEDQTSYKVASFYGPNETEVIIPESYNGLPVTEIGDNAFYRVYSDFNIEKIILPETITKIGYRAFANSEKLTTINIPSSVTAIDTSAFEGCKLLDNITLPNITVLNECVFYHCESLSSITIPNTVTEIKSGAFYECKSLTELIIPDNVTILGGTSEHSDAGVFVGCTSLKKITLSKNIKYIAHNEFASCTSLEELTIPEAVETIAGCAFYNCSNLKKLVVPRSVTNVECETSLVTANPTIYGYPGSYIEEFASTKGLNFVALEEITTVETKEVTINDEPVTVMPVDKETNISDFINVENFPVVSTYTITVYDATGKEKTDTENIGSRNVIKVTDETGNVLAEFTMVVSGDTTGDGLVQMYDAFTILKGAIFGGELDAIETLIRDFNNDGIVIIFDAFGFLKEVLF